MCRNIDIYYILDIFLVISNFFFLITNECIFAPFDDTIRIQLNSIELLRNDHECCYCRALSFKVYLIYTYSICLSSILGADV